MNKQEYRIFLEKYKIQHGYKKIDEEVLYNLIKEGYTIEELKCILNVGINTLYKRLDEFWGFSTLKQTRQAFFNENDWKKYEIHLRETQPSYIKVNKQKFIALIKKNLNMKEIEQRLN